MVAVPIVLLIYVASVLCQPRRNNPKDLWKLRLHFASFSYISQVANMVRAFLEGDIPWLYIHFTIAVLYTVLFHFGLKLRAAIGRLPDKDLETVLIDTLFKGAFKTQILILFLFFRTIKCMFEKGGSIENALTKCSDTSFCASTISTYLLLWWGTKIVDGSIKSEWRKELTLSIEKIARMSLITLRRGVAGFLTLVTGVCASLLFSMMSADAMDETTIFAVGLTGLAASFGVVISEIYSRLKAQRRRLELSESGTIEEQQRATQIEEPVEECSWVFLGVSFLLTLVYSGLIVLWGVTLEDHEIVAAFTNFRLGNVFNGLFNIFRIFMECLLFGKGLRLRESVAKLPPQELLEFLCQTILLKGVAAIGTMVFFSFEAVACFISQSSFDNGQCMNTSNAAMFLSVNLAALIVMSIVSKAVPKSVQRETVWELSPIATLKGLKWWQQLQGGLLTVAMLTSFYLLGELGVEGEYNEMVTLIGASGVLCLSLTALISMITLNRTHKDYTQRQPSDLELRSKRTFTTSNVDEGAIALAVI
ncbi:hypothetical protein TL16_g05184 [Triparma laevis f. inornata]|uniref:Uncharacterized protein n=1 Tax=Triparma laevis f. inornata TaxID=1714386 RepID=A0A9W7AGJ6_9STRA|nr:hypothetical protein TL16_g05184 [Triparma laevis f. inornata]